MLNHEIVICTHNRKRLLQDTLKSLNTATRPDKWNAGIIIIANACNDDTAAFLTQYIESQPVGDLPLRWFTEPLKGKSNALNTAIEKVRATFVSFIDDDHRLPIDYFFSVKQATETFPFADIICGKILPDWNGTEPGWIHEKGKYRIYPLPIPTFDLGNSATELKEGDAVPGGGNLVVRSDAFKTVGPFNTDFGPSGHNLEGSEDYDWVLRAVRKGLRLWYCPTILQYHYIDKRRLELVYLMLKAFKRTKTVTMIKCDTGGIWKIPKFMYKKVIWSLLMVVFTLFDPTKRRFHLVRLAAAAGELKGFFSKPLQREDI